MSFEDKSVVCADCGETFTFSVEDQEFFQSKGYTNIPKRCTECRRARKSERNGNGNGNGNGDYSYRAPRQMFPATCADCGKSTEVPFQPSQDRPVYCSDCYRKVRLSR